MLQYPKIELHLHLDCSLSYEVVAKIDPSITREAYLRDFVAPTKCASLADFLTRAPRAIALMQTADRLRMVVKDLFEQLQRDSVLYAEIRFAPLLHTEQGLTPAEVVSNVEAAVTEASMATGIEARLILCALRHYSPEQSMQTVHLVQRFRGTRVVGLDLAGDEAGFPLDAHIPAFHYAIEQGIFRTAHAGEASGAESVWETLKHLRPTRIGHGVRSSEDPALVAVLRAEQIHLEICPMSNIQTNIYETYADHPIDRLYRESLSLGVSTDTRMITPVTLRQEYEQLHHCFGWDRQHFLRCNLSALQAAFLPEEKKHELGQRLQLAYASYD
ncbi:MAG TPA: adenosine deaminase [Ktedonobacteraceae bacterium]|nr:adenosine deaminase [Ktedonobacteraceae bacterium]